MPKETIQQLKNKVSNWETSYKHLQNSVSGLQASINELELERNNTAAILEIREEQVEDLRMLVQVINMIALNEIG